MTILYKCYGYFVLYTLRFRQRVLYSIILYKNFKIDLNKAKKYKIKLIETEV